ncbi:Protein pim1-like protein 2, partial [Colletotrichum chlorophyti]
CVARASKAVGHECASKDRQNPASSTRQAVPRKPDAKKSRPQRPRRPSKDELLDIHVFGSSENCELGLGPRVTEALTPRMVPALGPNGHGVVQISAGGMHCVALTHDGKVLTWGVNDDGKHDILDPFESTPGVVAFHDDVDVVQGGDGNFGFLHEKPPKTTESVSVRIPGLDNIMELAGGANHVLAITNDGNVFAWGSGEQNELGRRILARRRFETLIPQRVGLPKNKAVKVFAGSHHSFAIDSDGKVWAFGLNNFGQCGISTREDTGFLTVISPIVVKSLSQYSIQHMACGLHHSIACTEEGQVLVWGRCDDGQTGLRLHEVVPREHIIYDSKDRPRVLNVPTLVPGLEQARHVAAGIDNCFVVTKSGDLYVWGFSASYNTGLRTTDTVMTPQRIDERNLNSKVPMFVAAGGQFTVAVTDAL